MKSALYRFLLHTMVCVCSTVWANAQSAWIDENYRKTHYPEGTYYSAYYFKYNENNDTNNTIDSALKEVQALLANSINSYVTSNSSSSISSINNNAGYTESEEFYNDIKVASDAHLINIHIEYYYDENSDIVHAFAFIKRSELVSFLDSHIATGLTILEEKIKGINDLINNNYKKEAKSRHEELLPVLNDISSYLKNLIAVAPSSSQIPEYSRQIEEYSNIIKKFNSDLARSMTIYFESQLDTPFKIRNFIPDKCKGNLASHGFSFVSVSEDADYIVKIVCATRTSSVSSTTCFAFADIDISIVRGRDQVNLYEDSISIKGGALTEEKAHRKAMDDAPNKIVEKILAIINE